MEDFKSDGEKLQYIVFSSSLQAPFIQELKCSYTNKKILITLKGGKENEKRHKGGGISFLFPLSAFIPIFKGSARV
jgi:hypothetical protein